MFDLMSRLISIARPDTHFRDIGRIQWEGALAVYRGYPPKHAVNPQVLNNPQFLQKPARRKVATAIAKQEQ